MTTSVPNATTEESLAAYRTTAQEFTDLYNSRDATWVSELKRHALMLGERIAIECEDTRRTWRELHDRVESLAHALARRGLGEGDRALVASGNSIAMLEFIIAVHQLGGVAVPMNFRLTEGEFAWGLDNAEPKIVLSDRVTAPIIEAALAEYRSDYGGGDVRHITQAAEPPAGAESFEALVTEVGEPATFPTVPARHPAHIMYTSGTTGRPKGAVITHQNMFAQALIVTNVWPGLDDEATFLLATPLFHTASMTFINACVAMGTRMVLLDSYGFDVAHLVDRLVETDTTALFLVPTQWDMLCTHLRATGTPAPKLQNMGWGAAPASVTLLEEMQDLFPDANIVALFGQTEMSPIACSLPGRYARIKTGSVGKPVPQVSIRIVDADMNDVAPGEIGEIVYRGPGVMLEYWRNEQKTREAFAGGWFHSGDLVRQDEDGYIYVVDRAKDMIISGGENIYCVEVENTLHAHPLVREVAIVGRPHPKWGEEPVAFVALADATADLSLADLVTVAEHQLARFKHPKDLIILDALPRNASGKVEKHKLRAEYFD